MDSLRDIVNGLVLALMGVVLLTVGLFFALGWIVAIGYFLGI